MLEQIGIGVIREGLKGFANWVWRRFTSAEIQVLATLEQGPTTRELGFTEPAVKITVMNKSERMLVIKDIRLMFCSEFGASVAPEAPPGRSHPELPMKLDSGLEENWHIPAQQLSNLLLSLHRPRSSARTAEGTVKLYARCITGTDSVCNSPTFKFSKDSRSHWSGL